jgi:polysaccharide biosynthesis transport protein
MSRQPDEFDFTPPEPARAGASPGLLHIAWRRKSLVLLGLILGLAGAGLFYAQRPPVYQSSAQVLVVKKRTDTLSQGVEGRYTYMDDYVPTHIVLIRSPVVAELAVRNKKLNELKTFGGCSESGAAAGVIGGLTVTRENKDGNFSSSNILNIIYRGPVAEDCPRIVNAVVESYEEFLKTTYSESTAELVKQITLAKQTLEETLNTKQEEYRNFRQKKDNLLYWKAKDGSSVHQARVQEIERGRSELLIRRADLEERARVFQAAMKDDRAKAELLALLPTNTARDSAANSPERDLEREVLQLQMKEQQLLDDYGPDHPQVVSLRRQIALTKDFYAKLGVSRDKQAADAQQRDPVERALRVLKADLEIVNGQLKVRDTLLEAEQKAIKDMASYEIDDEARRSSIDSTKQLYGTILRRIEEIGIAKDSGGFSAQAIAKPRDGFSARASGTPIFASGVLLGLLLGCGLAYLAEMSDKSFRTPEEIRRRLGLPVIGHIPYIPPGAEADKTTLVDPVLCSFYKPKSIEAESYRAVRTALYFSTQGQGHQVIQVTSPDMGDGKSTLVANLALSIAQSGKRVVLVDADFRRPRLHKLFGLSAQVGLASVIADNADLDAAVQKTCIPNLSLLPCGPIPPNPAELLTSPRFKDLLDQIRQKFDFVLVDTPPLLAVTDPCVVAPRVDGVLLTIRVSRNGRPHAERAKEILSTLGVKIMGVVVNGVGRQTGGQYGSEYAHYGYDYGPTYSYTYTPEDGDAGYYADADAGPLTDAANGANGPRADGKQPWRGRKAGKKRGLLSRLFSR